MDRAEICGYHCNRLDPRHGFGTASGPLPVGRNVQRNITRLCPCHHSGRLFRASIIPAAPLSRFNSYRLAARAEFLAVPRTLSELITLRRFCYCHGVAHRILGYGTNTLIRDQVLPGLTIRLAAPAFTGYSLTGTTILAGAGVSLQRLVATTARAGLGGMEVLAGIPGTVGGAVACNSGTRHGTIGPLVRRVWLLTAKGEVTEVGPAQLRFEYRTGNLAEGATILAAEFALARASMESVQRRRCEFHSERSMTQPVTERTAGCVFRNPGEVSAGFLIDLAGLKGARVGKAIVSERHGNFIVAEPGATGRDIYSLLLHVQQKVFDWFRIDLTPEVTIW